MPDLVYKGDKHGRYVLNNLAHLRFLGSDPAEQVAGKTAFDFFPHDLATQYQTDDPAALHGGQAIVNEVGQTVDGTGKKLWVSRLKIPLRDPSGTIIGILGVARDITERQRAEMALRESEAKLRAINETLEKRVAERSAAAEERAIAAACSERAFRKQTTILRSILDSMGDAVVVADESGAALHFNPAAKRLLDIEAHAARGKSPCAATTCIFPTDPGSTSRPPARAMRGESGQCRVCHSVWGGIGRQPLAATARLLVDADGTVRGGVVVFHDVTDHKRVEAELQRAKDAAEAANNAKSDFLANMSHEIRTPLTAIIGYADRMPEANQSLSRSAGFVCRSFAGSAHHLLSLISDALDISKIEAGQMSVEQASCDLPQLVADVISMMRPRLTEKGLDFVVVFDGPIPPGPHRLPRVMKQVLVNLLMNAIKFTPGGKVHLAG